MDRPKAIGKPRWASWWGPATTAAAAVVALLIAPTFSNASLGREVLSWTVQGLGLATVVWGGSVVAWERQRKADKSETDRT